MLIQEKHILHWIDHFYGHNTWEAKFWFIGYEEPGGDLPEEAAEKFDWFFNTHGHEQGNVLCDIRELYKHVTFRVNGPRSEKFANLYDYRFGTETKTLHGTWKNLIAFVHAYQNEKIPNLLSYQKDSFLSDISSEALIYLYPLPAHNHAWYYSWLELSPALAFLKSRALYERFIYAQRIRTILENIRSCKPALVLMYGMENINALKQSTHEYFPDAKFTMVKGTRLQMPQHHVANLGGTQLVLTTQVPSLRHNRAETGFDWQLLGENLRTGRS